MRARQTIVRCCVVYCIKLKNISYFLLNVCLNRFSVTVLERRFVKLTAFKVIRPSNFIIKERSWMNTTEKEKLVMLKKPNITLNIVRNLLGNFAVIVVNIIVIGICYCCTLIVLLFLWILFLLLLLLPMLFVDIICCCCCCCRRPCCCCCYCFLCC